MKVAANDKVSSVAFSSFLPNHAAYTHTRGAHKDLNSMKNNFVETVNLSFFPAGRS